jgi:Ca-activated chloride channel family protein
MVILMLGIYDDDELVEIIEKEKESGVYLTILGYGMGNYKDAKMEKLSNAGNGNYAYIDNLMEAEKMFSTELQGTLFTIAKDVKIQIEFNPALISSYRLIGYENRILDEEDFNNDSIDAGDIGAGHTVTALYEIVLNEQTNETNDSLSFQKIEFSDFENLLKVNIRYKDPDKDRSKLMYEYLSKNDISKKVSEDFLFAVAVAEYGLLLRESAYKGNADFDKAIKNAKKGYGKDEFGYRHSFVEMVKKTKLLMSLADSEN